MGPYRWPYNTHKTACLLRPDSMPLTQAARGTGPSALSRLASLQHSTRSFTRLSTHRCHYQLSKTSKHYTPLLSSLLLRPTLVNPSTPSTLKMSGTQTRTHAGHSHSHTHDNTYLISKNKKDAGVRITRVGLFVNLAMAIGKGIGGYVFHSQALVADAFHSLTDLVSDFMTLATLSWSLKPPTERFPSGYGKVESLGALGVSGLLLFGGIGMGLNAVDALYSQFFVEVAQGEHSHGLFSFLGHDHSHGASLPDLNAAWLAGGSIVVKEWLYRASKSGFL